jgi:hypothetical protein
MRHGIDGAKAIAVRHTVLVFASETKGGAGRGPS